MEAVIATGGKQYCVTTGQVISVEKLPGEKGAAVEFKSVLLVNRDGQVISGEKALSGAKVSGEVVAQGRRRKVMSREVQAPEELSPEPRPPPGGHDGPDHEDRGLGRDGSQEGRRQLEKRPGLESPDARREAVRRPVRHGRLHPRPPARNAVQARSQRRNRLGRHAVREAGRLRAASSGAETRAS